MYVNGGNQYKDNQNMVVVLPESQSKPIAEPESVQNHINKESNISQQAKQMFFYNIDKNNDLFYVLRSAMNFSTRLGIDASTRQFIYLEPAFSELLKFLESQNIITREGVYSLIEAELRPSSKICNRRPIHPMLTNKMVQKIIKKFDV